MVDAVDVLEHIMMHGSKLATAGECTFVRLPPPGEPAFAFVTPPVGRFWETKYCSPVL